MSLTLVAGLDGGPGPAGGGRRRGAGDRRAAAGRGGGRRDAAPTSSPIRTAPLTDGQAADAGRTIVARRERREPVSHILGRKGFWKIMLRRDAGRADAAARHRDPGRAGPARPSREAGRFSVLDLGVGSGAILLAILAERPAAKGLGVDVSEEALAVARENAANLGLARPRGAAARRLDRGPGRRELRPGGLQPALYRAARDIAALEPEVRDHEPRLALDGGPDGLDAYRSLAPEILRVLRPGGRFAVEIGVRPGGRGRRRCSRAAGAVGRRDGAGPRRSRPGGRRPRGPEEIPWKQAAEFARSAASPPNRRGVGSRAIETRALLDGQARAARGARGRRRGASAFEQDHHGPTSPIRPRPGPRAIRA